jgi:hypothetical protein
MGLALILEIFLFLQKIVLIEFHFKNNYLHFSIKLKIFLKQSKKFYNLFNNYLLSIFDANEEIN